MTVTVTPPEIHSTGLSRMHKGVGFVMTFAFPAATSHTSRTMVLSIENKKSGKIWTCLGPALNKITVSGVNISVTIPVATIGTEGITLSKLIESDCTFGFDVYASTVYTSALVYAARGDIRWVDPRGAFNES